MSQKPNVLLSTPVFDWNYTTNKRFVVNAGGTSSGKTVSIMQVIGLKLCQKKLLCTVVAETVPKLKKGALRDFQDYCLPYIQSHIKSYNISERIYYFKNGSQLEFNSYENEQSARNGKRDILFLNEANGISWMIAWQLMIRTKEQCFFDYNPSSRFWVHDNIIYDPERKHQCDYFISDHRHNPFLTDDLREQIESIRDPEMYKVYARGQLGKLAGQVYNWNEIDAVPMCNSVLFGIDYGETNDPTALVKVSYNKVGNLIECFYVEELLYTPGAPPSMIKQIMDANGYKDSMHLLTEHDTTMAAQLRQLGVNATNAYKTEMANRILWMKQQNIYYSKASKNIKNEVSKCVWLENKDATNESNRFSNKRADGFDHAINATEYALFTMHMYGML